MPEVYAIAFPNNNRWIDRYENQFRWLFIIPERWIMERVCGTIRTERFVKLTLFVHGWWFDFLMTIHLTSQISRPRVTEIMFSWPTSKNSTETWVKVLSYYLYSYQCWNGDTKRDAPATACIPQVSSKYIGRFNLYDHDFSTCACANDCKTYPNFSPGSKTS